MGHVVRLLHILLVEKEGRIWFNIICLQLYQFERITWWCLYVMEFALQYVLKFAMLKKVLKKCHGVLDFLSSRSGPDTNFGKP